MVKKNKKKDGENTNFNTTTQKIKKVFTYCKTQQKPLPKNYQNTTKTLPNTTKHYQNTTKKLPNTTKYYQKITIRYQKLRKITKNYHKLRKIIKRY